MNRAWWPGLRGLAEYVAEQRQREQNAAFDLAEYRRQRIDPKPKCQCEHCRCPHGLRTDNAKRICRRCQRGQHSDIRLQPNPKTATLGG